MRRALPWLSFAGFLVLAGLIRTGNLNAFDDQLLTNIVAHRPKWLANDSLGVAAVTRPMVVVAVVLLAAGLLLVKRRYQPGLALIFVAVTSSAASTLGKMIVGRPRPLAPINLAPEIEPSFPSGHVTVATAVSIVVATLLAHSAYRLWVRILCVYVIALVAIDRLIAGAHWPTDVVGGLLLGYAVAELSVGLAKRATARLT